MRVRLVVSSSRLSGNPIFGAPLPAERRVLPFLSSVVGHILTIAAVTSFVGFDQQYERNLVQKARDDRLIEVVLDDPKHLTAPPLPAGAGADAPKAPEVARHSGSGKLTPPAAAATDVPTKSIRQFQVPELKQVKRSLHQTILEPALPPEVAIKLDVQLPAEILLSPGPKIAPPPKQFVAPPRRQTPLPPGHSNRTPVFDTPNFEVKAAEIEIADQLWNRAARLPRPPSTTSPVRANVFDDTVPQLTASLPQTGDPINLVSIPDRPLPPVKGFVVPQGNEISVSAGSPSSGPSGASAANGEAPKDTVRSSLNAGSPAKGNGADEGAERASGLGDGENGTDHSEGSGGSKRNSSVTAARETVIAGNGSSASKNAGPSALSPSASTTVPATPGVKTITFPKDGKYEVVIVQSSSMSVPGTAGILSGRPVYTVYVQAGGPKEWIMQYCLPRENQEARTSTGVVTLGSPAPLKAPYPYLVVRPAASLSLQVRYLIVHGFVNATGKFEHLAVVGGSDPSKDTLLALLGQWEFRPAQKDGQPIAVEILLVIPKEAA